METVVKYLVLPSNLITLSAIFGILLFALRSTRKWGGALCIIAFACYLFFGAGPVAFWLLGNLEYRIAPASASQREGVRKVVVLAAHAESDPNVPLSSRISGETAFRLLEVISIFRAAQDSLVIISGGGPAPAIMREVLVSAGIPSDHLVIDGDAFSTFESAHHLSPTIGTSPFLLVTSAGHMPRAIGVFQKAGTVPLAAPTHYLAKRNWLAIQYLPSPVHLAYSDLAVSEYAALSWYRLKGWL
ncbi:YdcF family protein [Nitrospira sp. NS4]|uniref:YdcF family protein n=1 Tax=Nitrospira sp. NS4 TaxID=3414498 RepID=UPI003C2BC76C